MPLTRAAIEYELVNRTYDLLMLVGISVQFDGANVALNGPIAYGVRRAGGTISDISGVTDAEIEAVSGSTDTMLDLAEYRLLENCRNRFVKVRTQLGLSEVHWNQIRDSLDKRLEAKARQLATTYGIGLGTLVPGVITMPNVTTDPEQTVEL